MLQRLSRHGPGPGRDRRHEGRRRHLRRRLGRHAQHLGHDALSRRTRKRTRQPARQGIGAALHLGLRVERGDALDARQDHAERHHLFGRAEPRLDDRGDQARPLRQAHLPPQRSRAPPRAAGERSGRRAESDRVRVRLFDGWRRRADGSHVRPRRRIRRDDLSRRSPRCRHVRRRGRRRRPARQRHAPHHHLRRHAGQGLRRHGRLHRFQDRDRAMPSARWRRASSSRPRPARCSPPAR